MLSPILNTFPGEICDLTDAEWGLAEQFLHVARSFLELCLRILIRLVLCLIKDEIDIHFSLIGRGVARLVLALVVKRVLWGLRVLWRSQSK